MNSTIGELVEATPRDRFRLRGVEFGPVMGASGVQGFFGEGYPYHKALKMLFPKKFSFKGMTFVAKTTTLLPRQGFMPLKKDGITPKHWLPRCIVVNFRGGYALNAVGLSGPGAEFLFESGRWNSISDNFFISFMSVEGKAEARQKELVAFVSMCRRYIKHFSSKVGLQINLSCPNVGLHPEELIGESRKALDIAGELGIPLVPKINLLISPRAAADIVKHPQCDAICVSNTIPWGALPDKIDWKGLFGTDESPLKEFGGGGLSGAPLLPLLVEWLEQAWCVVNKPIIAGGGIMGPRDFHRTLTAPPRAISLGTIAMLRPWNLAKTINEGNRLLC